MKLTAFVLFLLNFTVEVFCEDSRKEIQDLQLGSFGYELIELRLDYLQERLLNSCKDLEDKMKMNQIITNNKIANLTAINSKLLERIIKLESIKSNRNLVKEPIASMIALEANNADESEDDQTITSCNNVKTSGVFKLKEPNSNVYCEMNTFQGGWFVLQQRVDSKLGFNRSWTEYRDGFGTVGKNTSFWLGLETTHQIIAKAGEECELAIEVREKKGHHYKYARYSQFRLAGQDDKYRLTVGNYSGTAEDKFTSKYNNQQFSTYDSDNDKSSNGSCATLWNSGWWFENCFYGNLNYANYGIWKKELSYTRMMVRCR